jgi:myo-inositol-hexaphosphate 3-phosphohydrolase
MNVWSFGQLVKRNLQDDFEAAANPDKCNLLSITTKRKPEHFHYNLHGHILESVDSAKYLGIALQSNLKWNKHIKQHQKQTKPFHLYAVTLKSFYLLCDFNISALKYGGSK